MAHTALDSPSISGQATPGKGTELSPPGTELLSFLAVTVPLALPTPCPPSEGAQSVCQGAPAITRVGPNILNVTRLDSGSVKEEERKNSEGSIGFGEFYSDNPLLRLASWL